MTPPQSISTLGERDLIERLRQRLGVAASPAAHVVIGIGDDAAVLAPDRGMHVVVTTDALVEGVHFRREWTSPSAIGHKALAVNLSDLAAMGALPRSALLSLAMPADFPLTDFDDLIDGFTRLAIRSGTRVVGGNMTRSPGPLIVDVTAMGAVRPRRVLRRTGARRGDYLYVTGTIGGAAAGLAMLATGRPLASFSDMERACIARYETPEPRLRLAAIVAKTSAAAAAIDLSDGLGDAAVRLAGAAGLGVVIDAAQLPIEEGARQSYVAAGVDPEMSAVAGGEDYELAFAVSPRRESRFLTAARRCPDVRITRIGVFVDERGAWLESGATKSPVSHGFDHF